MDFLAADGGKLFQQLFLFGGEMRGRLGRRADELVALAVVAVGVAHAFPFQAKDFSRLRAGGNFHLDLALERRHVDLRAERGLHETDRHIADDVESFADEKRMLRDLDDDVQIAGLPAIGAAFAFVPELQARAVIDAGRNLDAERVELARSARAAAFAARLGDERALSAALAAGAGHSKEALLKANLPTAAAGRACLRRCAGFGAAAVAGFARAVARDFDLFLDAENGFLESDVEVVAQIVTAAPAPPRAGATAEEFAEDIAEYVLEARGVKIETAGKRSAVAERGVTELVILRALLGIAEDGIRLRDFLEALLRLFVSGIAVGMILERQLAVGFFELFFVGVTGDTEDFVVIALAVQFEPSLVQKNFYLYITEKPLSSILKEQGLSGKQEYPPDLFLDLLEIRIDDVVFFLRAAVSACGLAVARTLLRAAARLLLLRGFGVDGFEATRSEEHTSELQ